MEKVVHIFKLGEEKSDLSYWMTKSVEERIYALESLIRNNYEKETKSKNNTTTRLQRVYRVINKISG